MTTKNSLLAKLSGGLSAAVLALTFSFGGPAAVRAEDPDVLTPSLQELVVAPIMNAVDGLEQRLAHLEESVGMWADSIMTRRMIAQELCLADESGAQTCITKGQLDALLRTVAQAETAQPPVAVTEASPPTEEAIAVVVSTEQAALPVEPIAVPADALQAEPELEQTGSVNSEALPAPGAALVSVPDVETTIAVESPDAEAQ